MATSAPHIEIELTQEDDEPITPGSSLICNITLRTNRPIEVVSIQLVFRSMAQLSRHGKNGYANLRKETIAEQVVDFPKTCTSPMHACGDFRCIRFVNEYCKKDWKFHEEGTVSLRTRATFRMRLDVPENAPVSWSTEEGPFLARVWSKLWANVVYHRLDAVTRADGRLVNRDGGNIRDIPLEYVHKLIVHRGPMPVERLGQHESAVNTAKRNTMMCWGRIESVLTAPDKLGVLGQEFPVMVNVRNGSFKTLGVSLGLYQAFILSDTDKSGSPRELERVWIKLQESRLPAVAPRSHWEREIRGFTISEYECPSGVLQGCTVVQRRYFVRLNLKWRSGSLINQIEVFLGTHAEQSPRPPSTTLEPFYILE